MKKMWLGGFAVLLILAMAGCDGLAFGSIKDGDSVQYTEDGRQMVNLTINTGGARALTQALAQAGINYYEVVFYDGTTYYRTAGYKGQTLKLWVPPDTYASDSTGKCAVVFAGNDPGNGDNTLLAVGKLSLPANGIIDGTTTGVTFTLTALTTDVKAAPDTSFVVTNGAPGAGDPYGTVDYLNTTAPYFLIDRNLTSATATYTIGGMSTSAMASGGSGPDMVLGDFVMVKSEGTLASWGLTSTEPTHTLTPVTPGTPAIAPASGAIGTAGELTLTFDTPNAVGWGYINIDVPVCALATTIPNGTLWHIRGGLKNQLADTGSTGNSTGGGIILGIGSPSSIGITITGP